MCEKQDAYKISNHNKHVLLCNSLHMLLHEELHCTMGLSAISTKSVLF